MTGVTSCCFVDGVVRELKFVGYYPATSEPKPEVTAFSIALYRQSGKLRLAPAILGLMQRPQKSRQSQYPLLARSMWRFSPMARAASSASLN